MAIINKNKTSTLSLSRAIMFCVVCCVVIYLALPAFLVIPMSFGDSDYISFPPDGFSLRWYREYFRDPNWTGSTIRSLQVALLTAICSVILGSMASYAIVRGQFKGKSLLQIIFIAPLIVPLIVLAVAIYGVYAPLRLIGTLPGFVIAHTILGIPYVVLTVTATLQGFDTDLEKAAMNLGASRLTTFLKITLPNIWPGVLAGGIFAFVISFDELVIANFISGIRLTTLPKQMFDGIKYETSPVIPAASTLLILVAFFLLFVLTLYNWKKNHANK